MKVIQLKPDTTDAIETIEMLKKDILDGKIIAFAAVGVSPDDCTVAYAGSTVPVSRLRLMGAMSHFNYLYGSGEE